MNVLQQFVQQLFAQMLPFLRHNTSRNSWFTFIAIAGKRFLRLVVQTLVLKPGDMMCLRLVVQLVVTIPFESLCLQLLTADCDDITVDVIIADPSTDSADVTAADPSCCLLILLTSSSP
ncbi:hypothetical protein F511_11718 [Dorcoceras hygrometricum]|uniref:Uncharacterized protein n=1 Tax=Dorcoceras hygrometricum TaxID=472368 RepID=A0A2Z7CA62_9LAMI|nr:hypothetical protein F511_11718 [Dorcoceras hygrometricum]